MFEINYFLFFKRIFLFDCERTFFLNLVIVKKKTHLFYMHKQVLHRLNKSQNFQELARVVIFFDFEELKEVCWNKLNIEIEKGQKDENAANFFSVQNKIRDVYLYTDSFDEILPMTVQLYSIFFGEA
ncbi:hypothetical protein RFI_29822 [Reticulomyxa filosa]|uniref:Uncharacterized protein n=1 Tax=Reticulomyxa filosa TaxID=46433 RepID=X6M3G9_RETFI|nr:hypothetical protein RFI_29822 [Reticulomyxa filosa]|eukprot:ETO07570.1 hypothetical protein RFI_29822 [Reticulomyxa filosa]